MTFKNSPDEWSRLAKFLKVPSSYKNTVRQIIYHLTLFLASVIIRKLCLYWDNYLMITSMHWSIVYLFLSVIEKYLLNTYYVPGTAVNKISRTTKSYIMADNASFIATQTDVI